MLFLNPPPQTKAKAPSANATAFTTSCMQQVMNASSIYDNVMSQFMINGGESEDYLYLSIWTPETTKVNLPVFVYIPGAGYTTGGQNSLYKIPDQ